MKTNDVVSYLVNNGDLHLFRRANCNLVYFRKSQDFFTISDDFFLSLKINKVYSFGEIKEFSTLKNKIKKRNVVTYKVLDIVVSHININALHLQLIASSVEYSKVVLWLDTISLDSEDLSQVTNDLNDYIDDIEMVFLRKPFVDNDVYSANNDILYNSASKKSNEIFISKKIYTKDQSEYSVNNEITFLTIENPLDAANFATYLFSLMQKRRDENILNIFLLLDCIFSESSIDNTIMFLTRDGLKNISNPLCNSCWSKKICWGAKIYFAFNVDLLTLNSPNENCKHIRHLVENVIFYFYNLESNFKN